MRNASLRSFQIEIMLQRILDAFGFDFLVPRNSRSSGYECFTNSCIQLKARTDSRM